jgi:glycolate oxidase iron-sulfur subunit
MPLRIAYHDACHLAHGQGIRQPPRALLGSIPGVSIEPLGESEICCGSAGIFNLIQPEMAGALGRRKADHIETTGADAVVTSNPGCIMQIRAASQAAGRQRPIVHIVEILDAAVRGVEAAAFLRQHAPQ